MGPNQTKEKEKETKTQNRNQRSSSNAPYKNEKLSQKTRGRAQSVTVINPQQQFPTLQHFLKAEKDIFSSTKQLCDKILKYPQKYKDLIDDAQYVGGRVGKYQCYATKILEKIKQKKYWFPQDNQNKVQSKIRQKKLLNQSIDTAKLYNLEESLQTQFKINKFTLQFSVKPSDQPIQYKNILKTQNQTFILLQTSNQKNFSLYFHYKNQLNKWFVQILKINESKVTKITDIKISNINTCINQGCLMIGNDEVVLSNEGKLFKIDLKNENTQENGTFVVLRLSLLAHDSF